MIQKTLFRIPNLIAFWRNACILHGTIFDFHLATVNYHKYVVKRYILTGK